MKTLISLFFVIVLNLSSFADTTYVYQLPFEEDFHTGLFTTNGWTLEGQHWVIAGQQGNPAPAAMFTYTPADTNYSESLVSPTINGSDFVSGYIFLDFDLKFDVQNPNGLEKLSAEAFDGVQWVTFYTDSNTFDSDWRKIHVNITEAAKGDTFQIRFRAFGESTININNWQIDNIIIYRECPEPFNLTTSKADPYNHLDYILLEWESPDVLMGESDWVNWDDGTNVDAIGLQGGGTFLAAARFTATQLSQYAGGNLSKIRIFPYGLGGTITLKVWTGNNASTLVLSQPVVQYSAGDWNTFELDNGVPVTAGSELWIGYEVTNTSSDYVAGVDGGPAIAGFGDMISLDGSTWESMSQAYQLDYNWNLQGWIEFDSIIFDTLEAQGYNIYLEDEWIAYTTELWYLDNTPFRNTYCYNVSAVYQDCESELSNESCVWINTTDLDPSKINIFPNPASDNVKFELDGTIRQILIYNLVGEIIGEFKVSDSQLVFNLELKDYHSGVYLVKLVESGGESIIKKLIVAQ